jgi:hypothetical protein
LCFLFAELARQALIKGPADIGAAAIHIAIEAGAPEAGPGIASAADLSTAHCAWMLLHFELLPAADVRGATGAWPLRSKQALNIAVLPPYRCD